MAKNKITDYDVTAAGNTDVGGIDIRGTANVRNHDDGMRTIMSHLAKVNAGTDALADTVAFGDPADLTKRFRIDVGNVSTATTRVMTLPDQNVTITAAGAAILDDADAAAQLATLGAVSYDAQTLTSGQQAQAKANISAIGFDAQTLTASEQGQARTNIGADVLGGFRNKLINPLGTINQRGYVSGAATSGANQYTLDRWRVVTSGQNLSWTESEGFRTITAPAGGVEQLIEGSSILTGTYVLSWEGTATATVNGTPRTKGETFTLTGGTICAVRFIGGTFSKPQLEEGVSPTNFSHRHVQQEFAMCQRYFTSWIHVIDVHGSYAYSPYQRLLLPTRMRAAPSVSLIASSTSGSFSGPFGGADASSFSAYIASTGAESNTWVGTVNLDAEL